MSSALAWLFVLWLGFVPGAWAACSGTQTAHIASGGTAVFDCADAGFTNVVTAPQHGTVDPNSGAGNNPFAMPYVNNGDGATLDTFTVNDDAGRPVQFSVTIDPPANQPLAFTTTSVASPTYNVAYSQQVQASGGTAPYTFSVDAGALPQGIGLSSAGQLSGTTRQTGSFSFTLRVTDAAAHTATQAFSVTVAAPTITVQPASLPNGTQGTAYTSTTIAASGGAAPYTFAVSAGALPGGLSLSTAGVLSGTPTAAGTFNATVRATDAGGITGTRPYTIVIAAPPLSITTTSLADMAYNQAYSQQVQVTGGVPPYTYSIVSGAPPGITISSAGGVIGGTPIQAGSYNIAVRVVDSAGTPNVANKTFAVTVATPTLTMGPASLADAREGLAYSAQLTTSGGTPAYTYTLPSGGLPAGLTLSTNGAISGTPTQSGSFTFLAQVTDSTPSNNNTPATAQKNYTLQVAAAPTITVSPASAANATYGQAYGQTFSASGGTGPYTFASTGTIPPGLTLSGNQLSGTPTATGSFNFTIRATDQDGYTGQTSYTLTVSTSVPGAPTGVGATAGPGTASVGFTAPANNGGGSITGYTVTSNPGGITATGAGSPIQVTGLTNGVSYTFTVSATNGAGTGPSSSPSPAVTPKGTQTLTFNNPGTQSYGTAPTLQATSSSGLAVSFASSTTGVCTITTGGTLTFVRSGTCTIVATQGGNGSYEPAPSVTQSFAVASQAPGAPAIGTATTQPAPAGQVTGNASVTFSAPASDGGSTVTGYTVTSSPGGITASGSGSPIAVTGLALGTAYTFTVTATTSSGVGPASTASNSVTPMAQQAITFNPPGDQDFGTTRTLNATASSGLSVSYDSSTTSTVCTIVSGNQVQARAPGTCTVTANQAGNGAYVAASAVGRSFNVVVPGGAVSIATTSLPAPTRGVAYSQAIVAQGGAAPYTFTLTGALPAGLSFANGVISGVATASGSYNFTVQALDQAGQTASQAYGFTVIAPTFTFTPATLPAGKVGVAYPATTVAAAGGIAPYTYAVTAGALPTGLTISSTGVVSGTPTAGGTPSVTITATDAFNGTGAQSYTINVAEATPVAVDDTATVAANGTVTVPVTSNDTGPITAIAITQAAGHGNVVASGLGATYTPAHDFFGTDTFRYTATGPGGTSNVATVTITVSAGAVPTVTAHQATVLAGKPVTIHAAEGATRGPFTAVAVVNPPSTGSVTVQGFDIVYTPADDATGDTGFDYTLSNAFGSSQPARVTVTVNPLPFAPPVSAVALAGRNVRVNISAGARGGPFTGANVVSVSPSNAGAASIESSADGYVLVFNAAPAFGGMAQIGYTLSNAFATSAAGYVSVTVTARPDPSKDPEVLGVLSAQADATRRMAVGQISNFQRRLEVLHSGGTDGFTNGITVASAGSGRGKDAYASLRNSRDEASHRYLVQPDPDSATANVAAGSQHGTLPGDVSVWTGGAVNFGRSQAGTSGNGTDFTTSGLSFGVDKQFSDKLAIGAGVGYGHDNTDVGNNGSRSAVDSYNVALYGSFHPAGSFYTDALIGYQWLSFDSYRHITGNDNRVTGSRDGKQWFASLSAGYNHVGDNSQLTPYGRFDIARGRLDGYTEHGDDVYSLAYQGQTVKTATATVGVLAQWSAKRDYGVWAPQLRAEFGHDMQGSSSAAMRYADVLDGPLYRATLYRQSRNHTLLGAGIALQTNNGWMLRAEYQNQLDNTSRDNQSILLGVEKKFGP
ncbi:MAG: putative Ig domain-containing protein [Luteibacter sp.]